ncbi:MAG: flotillin domain-containing protein, partial [Gemmobacter sp.]
EQAEVDDTRVKSEVGTLLSMAEAEARATLERAEAQRKRLLAEAEGRAAVIAAENAQSPELMAMKLDEARLKALPDVVERLLKPAEKIESIRINQITGIGGASGGGGAAEGGGSTVNQVVDGVLSMALQLPAVQRLGEEVGMNIGDGVRGLAAQLDRRGIARGADDKGDKPADKA